MQIPARSTPTYNISVIQLCYVPRNNNNSINTIKNLQFGLGGVFLLYVTVKLRVGFVKINVTLELKLLNNYFCKMINLYICLV